MADMPRSGSHSPQEPRRDCARNGTWICANSLCGVAIPATPTLLGTIPSSTRSLPFPTGVHNIELLSRTMALNCGAHPGGKIKGI